MQLRSLIFRLSPLLACSLLVGCRDPEGAGDADATGPSTTVNPTDTGETDTGETDTGESTDTGPADMGVPECMGFLCGDPGEEECCDSATQECLSGGCVPVCETGIRCGDDQEICCAADEVCINPSCTVPGADCGDSYDCSPGEFCEPTLDKCLPQFDPNACEVEPEFGPLDIIEEWAWTDEQVISLPLVADVDGDGINEVIVVRVDPQSPGAWEGTGELVVLDGETGTELWRLVENPPVEYGLNGRGQPAVADVDGDDIPDIIYSGRPDLANNQRTIIYAVDGMGDQLWSSHGANQADYPLRVRNGAITVANFDDDSNAEIVIGGSLLDDDGLVVWDATGNGDGSLLGSNSDYYGAIAIAVDLDGDDKPEIVSGRQAWKVNWQPGPNVIVNPYWDAGLPDGYPAAADLDLDGDPEIVLVGSGTVRVLNGATGQRWCGVDPTDVQCVNNPNLRTPALPIPGGGRGGPPTIADFDGDGKPEIGVAGGSSYSVYDLNRPGEDIVQPMGDPAPSAGHIFVRWKDTTQDESSNVTGSSVFDFQGDGAAEVVYADECYMRVYDGSTGDTILQQMSSSATIHEYPLVADVDRDGNAELLVVANDDFGDVCLDNGYVPRRGVFMYGDANDRWVPTRRIWTQHAYHVTDATSDANVPMVELPNWSIEGLNNYRQNVQGEGVFNAPDLIVDLAVDLGGCPDDLTLVATVRNVGTLGVPQGILVSFYRGSDSNGELVSSMATIEDLLPGASTAVVLKLEAADLPAQGQDEPYYVAVDKSDLGEVGDAVECLEDNNYGTINVGCPNPG